MTAPQLIRRTLLTIRVLPWRITLPVLKHAISLPKLARLASPNAERTPDRELERESAAVVARLFRGVPRDGRGNCLERSLVLYRFLSLAGADPKLVVGMGHGGTRFVGHAWVVVEDEVVLDSRDEVARFKTLAEFGPGGRMLGGSGAFGRPSD